MSANGGQGREAVLGRVRAALGTRGDEPGRRGTVLARLERAPEGIVPARARLPKAEMIGQFRASLEAQSAITAEVASREELPHAIAALLAEHNLPPRLRHGDDAVIAALPWEGTLVARQMGPARPADEVSLSRAVTGAAETGTLFLVSGADNPSTLNFLPETHIIILLADDIVGSYEEAWQRLQAVYGTGILPRTVNLISGSSCTADIEQKIVRGAHGPRRLMVLFSP